MHCIFSFVGYSTALIMARQRILEYLGVLWLIKAYHDIGPQLPSLGR